MLGLIVHERLQWRDNKRVVFHDQGRYLIAERLPCSSRHDEQDVPAAQHGIDDFFLDGSKRRVLIRHKYVQGIQDLVFQIEILSPEQSPEPSLKTYKHPAEERCLCFRMISGMTIPTECDEVRR